MYSSAAANHRPDLHLVPPTPPAPPALRFTTPPFHNETPQEAVNPVYRDTTDLKGRGVSARPARFHTKRVVHTLSLSRQAASFATPAGQGAVMPCGWEGNRWSAVALAMRHRLQRFVNLTALGLRKEMNIPHSSYDMVLVDTEIAIISLLIYFVVYYYFPHTRSLLQTSVCQHISVRLVSVSQHFSSYSMQRFL